MPSDANGVLYKLGAGSSGVTLFVEDGFIGDALYFDGNVGSQALSAEAEKLAAGVYGVVSVKNEIKITP